MLLRQKLPQFDPGAVLHGRVVEVNLEPVPRDDGAARQGKDLLHSTSVTREPSRRTPTFTTSISASIPASSRCARSSTPDMKQRTIDLRPTATAKRKPRTTMRRVQSNIRRYAR